MSDIYTILSNSQLFTGQGALEKAFIAESLDELTASEWPEGTVRTVTTGDDHGLYIRLKWGDEAIARWYKLYSQADYEAKLSELKARVEQLEEPGSGIWVNGKFYPVASAYTTWEAFANSDTGDEFTVNNGFITFTTK